MSELEELKAENKRLLAEHEHLRGVIIHIWRRYTTKNLPNKTYMADLDDAIQEAFKLVQQNNDYK